MPLTQKAVERCLASAGLAPSRRLGQNFLISRVQRDRVLELAELKGDELILEVGPGLGALTGGLLGEGRRVVAVEVDRGLAAFLPGLLGCPPGLELIHGDVLGGRGALSREVAQALASQGAGVFKVVANLPYQISSPFLLALVLHEDPPFGLAVVMLQREVAERLRAGPGEAAYSSLGCLARLYLRVSRGPRLGPGCFHPKPGVESEVVVLRRAPARRVGPSRLLPFIRHLFQQRRKTLRRVLKSWPGLGEEPAALLSGAGISPGARVEEVDPERLEALFILVKGKGISGGWW